MTHASPPAAPTAAHAAPAPDPVPGAEPGPGGPAAAIRAALAGNPGAATAVIAAAAGIGRPAARDALTAMEKAGAVTRVKGGKPGIPDTWTLASATPDGPGPAPGQEDEQHGQPCGLPAGSPGDAAGDHTASGARQDGTAGPAGPAEQDDAAAPGPGTGQPGDPGGGHHDPAVPDGHDEAEPRSDNPQDPAGEEDTAPADGDGEASSTPDPALVTEITGRITQIRAAAGAAATALTEDGNLRAALAALDQIHEQAAQARRELKAEISGRRAPAARPGGLRGKVLAHLDAHPGGEFTPHEIHKVLGNSSGAIANALDTLVKLGQAEVATEKPRRFRRAAGPSAPQAPGTDEEDSAELAGAA